MKNVHVIPTDKPSRLSKQLDNPLVLYNQFIENRKFGRWSINQNIYITSDEEIKEGDYYIKLHNRQYVNRSGKTKFKGLYKDCKKIILTTDQDLIKNGVQAIPDNFLEWFVKNPNCEEVDVNDKFKNDFNEKYSLIIPKDEPKQSAVEIYNEFMNKYYLGVRVTTEDRIIHAMEAYKLQNNKAKWQQEQSYTNDEILEIIRITKRDEHLNVNQIFQKVRKK